MEEMTDNNTLIHKKFAQKLSMDGTSFSMVVSYLKGIVLYFPLYVNVLFSALGVMIIT
jgi:hypothetical protein